MSKVIWIINQYASTPDTGMGGRHYYLARELAKQGHKVYLIAASYTHILRKPPTIKHSYEINPVDGFNFVWVKMPTYSEAHGKQRVVNWFKFAWKITGLKKIITDKPDAILCSSPSLISFLGAKYLSKVYPHARLVFEVRDIWPLSLIELGGYSPKHPFIRLLQWIEDKAYRDSDRVISNLKNAAEHMVLHGMVQSKFTWVPNGFSDEEVRVTQELSNITIDKLPKNKFIVGYTGAFGVANALDSLIGAAEILKDNQDIAFVLVGNGKERSILKELVNERNLRNVLFMEPIIKMQIQAMLSNFDLLYIAAKKSPLYKYGVSPNKLYDYFYSGKPILYAIDSGNYKPISDIDCGIQIPPEDPQAIVDAVLEIYSMPKSKRDTMGASGHRYVIENHEYGVLAKKLENVLVG